MRTAVLAALCLGVTADDGSLLQVHTAMNDFDSIEDASRVRAIAERTGLETSKIESIFKNATKLMRQMGGPPHSFRDTSALGITDKNLKDANNHPLSAFLAKKENSDHIKQSMLASARDIVDTLKASNSSGESTIKAFAKSNEHQIQRFLFSADEAMTSRSGGNCALYIPNHKYTLKFYIKGYNGCPNRMAFRYRVQLKLDLNTCQYTFKGEDMSFMYKFKEDDTEIQWGDPIYWKGLANGFFTCKYSWVKRVEDDGTCNGDIIRWQLAVSWKINQANAQKGPKMGPCNQDSENDAGTSITFKWEDNVGRGGYPMRFEDAQLTWSYSHGSTWLQRWNGKKGYEADFTLFANQFIWGFAYAEVKTKAAAGTPPCG